jgi:UDP-N-acetyl-D-glucosamine dehydrogenase
MGLGYVGLPLMRTFTGAGFRVLGYDVDQTKVDALNEGRSYIHYIPHQLIRDVLDRRLFEATCDPKRLGEADAIMICVPTPLNRMREPDLSYVVSTARTIAEILGPGQLIVLESTTYPGTTREELKPILESTGLWVERDFYLAFSPEREDPGRTDFTTEKIPKVVGGIGPESLELACALYGRAISEVVPVSSCEAAEACKILENVYRCVNIALVNELKMLFDKMGIDVWEVIRAASTKPFGFTPFYPGPGLGGHCIPIDPFYLSWKARKYDTPTRFIELAGEINNAMPSYVIGRLSEALNEQRKPINGSKILVLGLAYKKDVNDIRESPSVLLVEMLKERGALVDYHDPFIPKTPVQREHDLRMTSVDLTPENVARYDCVVIATDHSQFDYQMLADHAELIIDTRNACGRLESSRAKIVQA